MIGGICGITIRIKRYISYTWRYDLVQIEALWRQAGETRVARHVHARDFRSAARIRGRGGTRDAHSTRLAIQQQLLQRATASYPAILVYCTSTHNIYFVSGNTRIAYTYCIFISTVCTVLIKIYMLTHKRQS